jgi:hypothetical protein
MMETFSMEKLASIYLRKGKIFISASHKTEAGFWIADDQSVVVENSDESGICEAVGAALARSKHDVPTPPRDANLVRPLLAAANVSSWSTFAKLAKYVNVHLGDGELEITPYRNMGGSDGFEPITESAVMLPEGSSDLGNAILTAFAIAE